MFASEPKLFSIGIINIPLESLETIVINIVQPEKTTETLDPKQNLFTISKVVQKP
jgi:hypothetical protein